MHGLINSTLQRFLRDTYGEALWADVCRSAAIETGGFEAMLFYEDRLTLDVLAAAALHLDKPRSAVLEDVGTYLVSHPSNAAVRRLLRFSGITFVDFVHSLDELPERTRLAVADLDLPEITLFELEENNFSLEVATYPAPVGAGFGHVLMGLLRAMADDYGALALLDHQGVFEMRERITLQVVETAFADGRDFALGAAG